MVFYKQLHQVSISRNFSFKTISVSNQIKVGLLIFMVLFGYFTTRFTVNSNAETSKYSLVKAKVIHFETVFNITEEKLSDENLRLCYPNAFSPAKPNLELASLDFKSFQSNVSLHNNVPLFLSYRNFRI